MALGRYSRIDTNNNNKSSTSYCNTATIVVFMGLCLVGIWMITSSWVVPDQNVDDAAEEKKSLLKDQPTPAITDSNNTSEKPQFDNKPNDARKDAPEEKDPHVSPKDDGNTNLNANENPFGNKPDDSRKDMPGKDSNVSPKDDANANLNAKEVIPGRDSNVSPKGDGNANLNAKENQFGNKPDDLSKVIPGRDSNVSPKEDGNTNLNAKENQFGNKPDDLRKDISGRDSNASPKDDGNTNLNAKEKQIENRIYDQRKDIPEKDSNMSPKDDGNTNLNTKENKFGNNPDDLHKDIPGRDSNVSPKDDGKTNLNEKEKENQFGNRIDDQHNDIPGRDSNASVKDDGKTNFNAKENQFGNRSDDQRNDIPGRDSNVSQKDDGKTDFKEKSEGGVKNNDNSGILGGQGSENSYKEPHSNENDKKTNLDEAVKNHDESSSEIKGDKIAQNDTEVLDKSSDGQVQKNSSNEAFLSGGQSELMKETKVLNGSFSTQAAESKTEKDAQPSNAPPKEYNWKLCNSTAGPDFIPCLDNWKVIRHLHSTKHYEHRERHCPEVPPTCLVPLPEGYKIPIEWPKSRDKIWYKNVPHSQLVKYKGGQNWLKIAGDYLTFPGGGTQFRRGALHYIDFMQKNVPDIAWGKHTRVVLDVGCGVASFGGFLFERDVLTMSLAPKDEHEAQVQFALERGIPAISAVMGTKRLPYPSGVFDIIHCSRCRVPWHIDGGKLLLELNRLLRPGGFFVWSATPVYWKKSEDVKIWKAMMDQTKRMCWELVNKTTRDPINKSAIATFRKPTSNDCYEKRSQQDPPICPDSDDPNAAWNVSLQTCMHKVTVDASKRGFRWPEQWPERLETPPYWMLSSQIGVYGRLAPDDFTSDSEHWKLLVAKSYMSNMGIDWSAVRNVMDMRAIYGGFASALKDKNLWVMNVVPVDSPDTLPIIYERGLFGIYHDWCESFSTYPRSYDLLHADHLLSKTKKRCNFVGVVTEIDRILRPGGKLIVRDDVETISELENMFRSMHWEIQLAYTKDKEGLLCVSKTMWRPNEVETLTYAIAN